MIFHNSLKICVRVSSQVVTRQNIAPCQYLEDDDINPFQVSVSDMKVLVTGGAGYIGSHTCVELLEAGHDVLVVDNLSNSSEESLKRVQQITDKFLEFHNVDLVDGDKLDGVFRQHPDIGCVIHFAGLKAVAESVSQPLRYYNNNILGTVSLLEVMMRHSVYKLIFSSSATVYGAPHSVPIFEDFPLHATNPYGRTKFFIEEICKDWCTSCPKARCVLLRYFNPVGGHESGLIGEDPLGIPNNLMPYVAQVAVGKLPHLNVFGNDYPTRDGTGVRDYVHVVDLAQGHLSAMKRLEIPDVQLSIYNLGLGVGYSVLEMITEMRKVTGQPITYNVVGRRMGDVAECYSNCEKALKELNWRATRDLRRMCEDLWRWQSKNPNGYARGTPPT